METLIVEAWKTGGPQLALLVLGVLTVARLSRDKERLYERLLERERERGTSHEPRKRPSAHGRSEHDEH